ncbi:hypothetical protein GCAAIG_09745 [Candidatus Electronema halotolerans]
MSRVKGRKEDTISKWLLDAAEHAEDILLSEFHVSRGRIDGLWFVYEEQRRGQKDIWKLRKAGQLFRWTCIANLVKSLKTEEKSGLNTQQGVNPIFISPLCYRGESAGAMRTSFLLHHPIFLLPRQHQHH